MSHVPSNLESVIAGDVAGVLLADLGVAAEYRGARLSADGTVRVHVGSARREPRELKGGAYSGRGSDRLDADLRVIVPALAHGEVADPATGVGPLGGVETLREGDRLRVPGVRVNRPGDATVDVIVRGDVERVAGGGHWSAGVRT